MYIINHVITFVFTLQKAHVFFPYHLLKMSKFIILLVSASYIQAHQLNSTLEQDSN